MKNLIRLSTLSLMLFGATTFAHSGVTNSSGCHSDGTGYHCHTKYGQNTYPSYRCGTTAYNGYSRYGHNDARSMSYRCEGGTGHNSYNNYSRYNSGKNYQTYYGTPTYHNYYQDYGIAQYQKYKKYYDPNYNYGKDRYHSQYEPRRVYGNQLVDQNTRYYTVPTRYGTTMRNYNVWPYTR